MQESGENYLETILLLEEKKGNVRSIDVATELGFSKPSISRAMGILRQSGLLVIDEGGRLLLTEAGRQKAEAVYERHRVIRRFMMLSLSLPTEIADRDACRIEHVISEETFAAIKRYVTENSSN